MKLVLTLLTRDEEDVVEANIAYHLERGVDLVVATDNGSVDGTLDVLERYRREGHLHLIHEPGRDYAQADWVTRMARLAATDFGADWVLNGDADEFWWPDHGTLRDVLGEIPAPYGILSVPRSNFLSDGRDGGSFVDRMVVRDLQSKAKTRSKALPPKVAHRGRADVVIGKGAHSASGAGLEALVGWYPISIMHFPARSLAQWESKLRNLYEGRMASGRAAATPEFRALEEGRLAEEYADGLLDAVALERGVEEGRLVIDRRLQRFFGASPRLREIGGVEAPEAQEREAEEVARRATLAGSISAGEWQRRRLEQGLSREPREPRRPEKNAEQEASGALAPRFASGLTAVLAIAGRRARRVRKRLRRALGAGRRDAVRRALVRLEPRVPAVEHWRRRRRMAEADTVVLSFPKSGRTWLRYFLSQYLAETRAVPFRLRLHRSLASLAFSHARHMQYPGRPFRRHLAVARRRRVVVLVRDPRDVAVSWYHQTRDRERLVDCELPEFLDSPVWGIERQAAFVNDLLDFASTHPSALVITYEGLKRSTEAELRRFLEFVLGEPIDDAAFRRAMESSDVGAMRRRELAETGVKTDPRGAHKPSPLGHGDWDGNPDALKVRKAEVGGFRAEMDEASQAEVSSRPLTRRLLARLAELDPDRVVPEGSPGGSENGVATRGATPGTLTR